MISSRVFKWTLLLACLQPATWAVQFKLAIFIEGGGTNGSAAPITEAEISVIVQRRINNDWRMLAETNHSMVYKIFQVTSCQWTAAVRRACQEYSGYHGILAIGGCSLASTSLSLARSMSLPVIVVPTALCTSHGISLSNNSLVAMERPGLYINAAVRVIERFRPKSVVIAYDSGQEFSELEHFQDALASRSSTPSEAFQLDGINASRLADLMAKTGTSFVVVFASEESALTVLRQAASSGLLQVNYHWLLVAGNIRPSKVLEAIPSNVTPNVLLIRSPTYGQLDSGICSSDLSQFFDGCTALNVQSVQLRTLDSLISFARAFKVVFSNSSVPANSTIAKSSGASCGAVNIIWSSGSLVSSFMKSSGSFDTTVSIVKFNETSGYLQSGYLELYGTQAATFVESGRYFPGNQSIYAKSDIRNRRLVFPNAFVGFGNATLTVCSAMIQPYSNYNASSGDGDNYQDVLLGILARHLNFSYVLISPRTADEKPGAPWQLSSCIAAIKSGRAHFAMLFGITKNATNDVDFSTDVLPSWNSILVKRPPRPSKLWEVLEPFDLATWLLTIAFIGFASVAVYILAYFNHFTGRNLQLPYAVADEVWYQEYLFSVLSSFFQQGHDFYPFALSPRVVLAFWWMFTVVIYGAYTGELASQCTIIYNLTPMRSIDQLASSPEYQVLVAAGSSGHQVLTSGSYSDVFSSRVTLVDSEITCAEAVVQSSVSTVACVTDKNIVNYYATQQCKLSYTPKEQVGPTNYNGLVFPKDWPFISYFNLALQKAKESGVLHRLSSRYFPSENVECAVPPFVVTADPMTMEDIGGILVCTGVCYAVGFILIGLELLWTNVLEKDPF